MGSISESGRLPWRRKRQPTPVFLPGKFHGQRSLVGYSPQGHKRVGHSLATKWQQILHLPLSVRIHCLHVYYIHNNLSLFREEALPCPYVQFQFLAQYQAHRNYSINNLLIEWNNQPTCLDTLVFVLRPSCQPASLFCIPMFLPTGGFSANLFAWREAKCTTFDCSSVTPIVTSPLLLIAGLIKHSKFCPPTLTWKHFWMAKKTRCKLKRKEWHHTVFCILSNCHVFPNLWAWVRLDGRTVLIKISAMHSFHTAGRYLSERWCTCLSESFHHPLRWLLLCQCSDKETEAQQRNMLQTRPGSPSWMRRS